MGKAVLLMHCPDQMGIVSKVTNFLLSQQGNILDIDQHVDQRYRHFYMRAEWDFQDDHKEKDVLVTAFRRFFDQNIDDCMWEIRFRDRRLRLAIFVTKLSHCLYDIIQRTYSNTWPIDVACIISNHQNLKEIADRYEIPFHHFEVNKDNKLKVEKQQIDLLENYEVDIVALARYMQILSPNFIKVYKNRIINIHHSFLPAFPGAKPYHSAFERGVKIIGATSHFVTDELDAGPIIAQDVVHVSHKDDVKDLIRKGADLEKIVFARALYAQFENRILIHHNKTVVFD